MKSITIISLFLSAISLDIAFAGPVERELRDRGPNVGIPVPRPVPRRLSAIRVQLDSNRKLTQDTAQAGDEPRDAPPVVSPAPTPPDEQCLSSLRKVAEFDITSTPASSDPACTIPTPVLLHATRSGQPIQFSNGLVLDCGFAETLARFANGTMQALAQHHLGTAIKSIHSGKGFVCRRRNNAATGKLSEHAFGNAIDWVSFELKNGRKIAIRDGNLMKPDAAAFFTNLRKAACGSFTTVLGPGSNAAHDTHLHLDLGRSKTKKNPYRICE